MKQIRRTDFGTWFQPGRKSSELVECPPGARVSDFVPKGAVAYVNGNRAREGLRVPEGAIVSFWRRPAGLDPFTAALIGGLISGALSYVASKLFSERPGREENDSSEQASGLGFTRLRPVRTEGLPIGHVFGTIRTAGTIIREEIEVIGSPSKSVYKCVTSFGYGPIEALATITEDTGIGNPFSSSSFERPIPSGITLNGNNLQNYDNASIRFRKGTLDQLVVQGQADASVQTQVEVTLLADKVETALGVPALMILDLDYATPAAVHGGLVIPSQLLTNDAVWTLYARAYDMTDAADAFEVILNFAQGIGVTNQNNGNLLPLSLKFAVRYIELDSLGIPITTIQGGGSSPDGYVRLPFELPLVRNIRDEFQTLIAKGFLDPQTYIAGVVSKAGDFNGTTGFVRIQSTTPGGPTDWSGAAYVPGAPLRNGMFETWFRLNDVTTADQFDVIFAHMDTATNSGFVFGAENREYQGQRFKVPVAKFLQSDGTVDELLEVETAHFGNAAFFPSFSLEAGVWYHVCLCMFDGSLQFNNASAFYQIYIDGIRIISVAVGGNPANQQAPSVPRILQVPDAAPATVDFSLGHAYAATSLFPSFFDGDMDETRLWGDFTGYDTPATLYNFGDGTPIGAEPTTLPGFPSGPFPALICALSWTTEQGAPPDVFTPDITTLVNHGFFYAGTVPAATGVNAGAIDGAVLGGGVQDRRRLRARVEILRLSADSDNTLVADDVDFLQFKQIIEKPFRHPGIALVALEVEANEQLHTSRPDADYLIKGRTCPTWDGLSVSDPVIVEKFSANNAWVFLRLALDPDGGLGDKYRLRDIDLVQVKALADQCDQDVWDHKTRKLAADSDFNGIQFRKSLDNFLVTFGSGNLPPDDWQIGKRVRLLDFPEPDAGWIENGGTRVRLDDDLNRGYEILGRGTEPNIVIVSYGRQDEGDPWTDGAFLVSEIAAISSLSQTNAIIEGAERRHEFNGVIATVGSAWERLKDVLRPAFAVPIQIGSRLSVRFAADRAPIDMVGQGQILRRGDKGNVGPSSFAFSYVDRTDLPNAYQIEIRNENRKHAYSPVPLRDPDLDQTSAEAVREERIRLDGVTRVAEAWRFALQKLIRNRKTGKKGSFEIGREALPWLPGEVFLLSHELFESGVSGRNGEDSAGPLEIFVDREVVIVGGENATVRSNEQNILATVAVTEAPGTYPAGTGIHIADPGFTPLKDDPWIIGTPLEVEIVRIRTKPNSSRLIEWSEHTSDFYDESAIANQFIGNELGSVVIQQLNSTFVPAVRGANVSARLVRDRDGARRPKVAVVWPVLTRNPLATSDIEPGRIATVRVFVSGREPVSFEKVADVEYETGSAEFFIDGAELGSVWRVGVMAVSPAGNHFPLERIEQIALTIPLDGTPPPPVGALEFEVVDDRLVFSWTLPVADGGLAVEARRSGWVLGDVAFVTPLARGGADSHSTADVTAGIYRVRSRDSQGHYSSEVTVTVPESAVPGTTPWRTDYPTGIYEQEWSAFGSGWEL